MSGSHDERGNKVAYLADSFDIAPRSRFVSLRKGLIGYLR
jgi:hypothetical protein